MIGANRMKMHQSIALLRLSPKIDDTCYRPGMVFKLYESYSLEHIHNPIELYSLIIRSRKWLWRIDLRALQATENIIRASKATNSYLGDIFAMSFWLWKLNCSNLLLSQRSLQIKKISGLQN